MCNTFKDKRYFLILEAVTQLCKELQFCNLKVDSILFCTFIALNLC